MRLFPPIHTPESVAREIARGLRDGSVILSEPELSVTEAISKSLLLQDAIDAAMRRFDPKYGRDRRLTTEDFARAERARPGAVHEYLQGAEEMHADLIAMWPRYVRLVRMKSFVHLSGWFIVAWCVGCLAYFSTTGELTTPFAIAFVTVGCLALGLVFSRSSSHTFRLADEVARAITKLFVAHAALEARVPAALPSARPSTFA